MSVSVSDRIGRLLSGRYGPGLLAGALGLLLPLGFAPWGYWWLLLLALAGLYALTRPASDVPRPLLNTWLFGFSSFAFGLWWLYVSMHDYGGLPVIPALILLGLAAALLALFPMLAVWGFRRLSVTAVEIPDNWVQRCLPWLSATLFAACWTGAELLREGLLTGFPWLSVGYAAIDSPWVGYAPVFGVFGVGFLYTLSAALLAEWLLGVLAKNRVAALWPWTRIGDCGAVGVLAGLVLVLVMGLALRQIQWAEPLGRPVQVAVLQGNIDQLSKWTRAGYRRARDYYIDATFRQDKADIIVWPETAVSRFWKEFREENQERLLPVLQQRKQVLLLGTPFREDDSEAGDSAYYNAMVAFGAPATTDVNKDLAQDDGRQHSQTYLKRHLVPFGEYVPFSAFLVPWFEDLDIPYSRFSPGPAEQPLLRIGDLKVLPAICYEIIFGSQIAFQLGDANLIVNISNDGWFGRSPASYQHLEMARMRAIELARPLVRATNTGVSALIDASGGVHWRSGLFEAVAKTLPVQASRGLTPYARWRDRPLVTGLLFFLIISVFFKLKSFENNK